LLEVRGKAAIGRSGHGAHAEPRVVLQPDNASEMIAQPMVARSRAMHWPSDPAGKIGKIVNFEPRSAARSAKLP